MKNNKKNYITIIVVSNQQCLLWAIKKKCIILNISSLLPYVTYNKCILYYIHTIIPYLSIMFGLQVQALHCSNPCLGSQQGWLTLVITLSAVLWSSHSTQCDHQCQHQPPPPPLNKKGKIRGTHSPRKKFRFFFFCIERLGPMEQ